MRPVRSDMGMKSSCMPAARSSHEAVWSKASRAKQYRQYVPAP
jgi:hypothetical protein